MRNQIVGLSAMLAFAFCPISEPAAQGAAATDSVVARIDGDAITRTDLEAAQQRLPEQYRGMPLANIYMPLLDQVIDSRLIMREGRTQKLQDDPEVKKRVADLENLVIQEIYLSRLVAPLMTEAALRERYAKHLAANPAQEEVHARHILLRSEADAKAVLADLAKGGDFITTAKAKSIEPGAKESGGDLGFFVREDMVPEFAEAAFGMKPGEVTKAPVKTQFGFHIIRVEDRRQRAPATYIETREQLRREASQEMVTEQIGKLRSKAKVERFTIDGAPIPSR
jgi:peptidyl-prolyl cis-trans isomerase C